MEKEYSTFILRLFFGVAFIVAGLEKVLTFGMATGMFNQLFGAGLGTPMLVLAILLELVGGTALLVGWHTKWAAGALAALIFVAFVTTFKINPQASGIGMLREIMVMNTGGGNTAVNFAYFAALVSLAISGSSINAVKPDEE